MIQWQLQSIAYQASISGSNTQNSCNTAKCATQRNGQPTKCLSCNIVFVDVTVIAAAVVICIVAWHMRMLRVSITQFASSNVVVVCCHSQQRCLLPLMLLYLSVAQFCCYHIARCCCCCNVNVIVVVISLLLLLLLHQQLIGTAQTHKARLSARCI